MNKKLAEFCTSKGMAVNGMQAYGVINEYEVNVKELNVNQASNSGEYPYQFHFSLRYGRSKTHYEKCVRRR